jgi:hypothetical protein
MIEYVGLKYPQHIEVVDDVPRIKFPLPQAVLNRWLLDVSKHPDGRLKARSTVNNHISALVWEYRLREVTVETETLATLSKYRKFYRRKYGQQVAAGTADAEEGKKKISFAAFCYLAGIALCVQQDHFGCACFMVLLWNLMARQASVQQLCINHMRCVDDLLKINIPVHKTNQNAEIEYDKAICANPLMPEICPQLHCALQAFSRPPRKDKHDLSFFESGGGKSFERWQRSFVNSEEADVDILGTEPEDIGTHSYR